MRTGESGVAGLGGVGGAAGEGGDAGKQYLSALTGDIFPFEFSLSLSPKGSNR